MQHAFFPIQPPHPSPRDTPCGVPGNSLPTASHILLSGWICAAALPPGFDQTAILSLILHGLQTAFPLLRHASVQTLSRTCARAGWRAQVPKCVCTSLP